MKHILLFSILSFSLHFTTIAQTDTTSYEVVKNMPVFYEQLKQQLTYPMAWGNSPTKIFSQWRTEARAVLTECMQNLSLIHI